MEDLQLIDSQNLENWSSVRDNPATVLQSAFDILTKAKKAEYKKGAAWALGNIGAAHMWMSNYEEALDYTAKAREELSDIKDYEHEADMLYNLCAIFYFLGDYEKQLQFANESLKIALENDYETGKANAYNGIGLAYYTTEDYHKAIDFYEKGSAIADGINDIETLLKLLDGIGQAYLKMEKFDKALQNMNRILEITSNNEKKNIQSYALDGIGVIYTKKGDADNAIAHLLRSLSLREELEFKSGEAQTSLHLGEAYMLNNDFENATIYLNKAIALGEELQSFETIAKAYHLLSDIEDKKGDLKGHIHYYKLYHEAIESHNREIESKKLKTFELSGRLAQMQQENDRLNRYFNDVEVMSEIGHEITSTLSITEINEIVYNKLRKLMKVDGFGIGIAYESENIITFPGYIENDNVFESTSYELDSPDRMASVCYSKEQEILICDFNEEYTKYLPKMLSPVAGKAVQSLIYMPLKVKDKKIGVLTIQCFEKDAYTDYHFNIIRNLAIYVSIAIENARLYQDMESQVKERTAELEQNHRNMEVLNTIGKELISTLDFENVIERLYNNVNQLMDAGIFGVRLYDEENQTIDYKYDYEDGNRHKEIVVSMEEDNNYSVWCIKNNKEIFINNNEEEYARYVSKVDVVAGEFPYSLIFYPLRRNGKPFGLITVQSLKKNAYTHYHLNILKTLAHYSAIALSNAANYEIIQREVEKRTKELNEANITIQKKNQDITDSINYARRIQSALMPDDTEMRTSFDSFFYMYQPKDIVSGDFYWFYDFGDVVICAVGDCTGHGVPGALMSVICVTQINKHVKSDHVQTPEYALQLINDGIVDTLNQQEIGVNSYDGMDIAMCAYNKKTHRIHYSGAYRPLIIVRDGEMLEFAPNRFSLGGEIHPREKYIGHEIDLKDNDCVYMFTDGYPDQFGGPKNKKYLSKRFKELLVRISSKPFKKQEKILHNTFVEWMKDNEQVDDILVMGFKVSK